MDFGEFLNLFFFGFLCARRRADSRDFEIITIELKTGQTISKFRGRNVRLFGPSCPVQRADNSRFYGVLLRKAGLGYLFDFGPKSVDKS